MGGETFVLLERHQATGLHSGAGLSASSMGMMSLVLGTSQALMRVRSGMRRKQPVVVEFVWKFGGPPIAVYVGESVVGLRDSEWTG